MWLPKVLQRNKEKQKYFSKKDISIHEDIIGNFHYHIAKNDIPLCGKKNTMRRQLSLASWGIVSPHIGERYCEECEKMWIENEH